jgi:site-specific recombinase XerD
MARLPALLEKAMDSCDLSQTTRPSYRRALREFLRYLKEEEGITDLGDVTREVMTDYRLHLQTKTSRKDAPYAVSTQTGALNALRFLFRWLVKTGVVLADPTVHLSNPRASKTLPRVSKARDLSRLIRRLPLTPLGIRDRALIELFYGTGMRRAELCRLDVEDVDLEQRIVLIREGKGRKDRLVPLGNKAWEALADYLDLSRPQLLKRENRALFVGLGGRRLSMDYVSARVRELGRKHGLKLWPHLLRHSCATHLLRGKADIRHIQRLLGHRSLQSTERYTRVEVSDLRKVIERCHPREKQ